jgi:hypothetical protein
MGFKPDNECKEQNIADFSGVFTETPHVAIFRAATFLLIFTIIKHLRP